MTYRAPLDEQMFVLETIGDVDRLAELTGFDRGFAPKVATALSE